jgi:hypothetical protein
MIKTVTSFIPAQNIFRLENKIQKFNRKGANFSYQLTGESKLIDDPRGWSDDYLVHNGMKLEVVEVALTGKFQPIEGWRFTAAIEHDKEGNIVNGEEGSAAKYSHAAPTCEHCKTNRYRRHTFIVTHEDGTERQIGKSCLLAYFGKATAESLISDAKFLDALSCFLEDDDLFKAARGEQYYLTESFVNAAIYSVEESGFRKNHEGTLENPSTADDATNRYTDVPAEIHPELQAVLEFGRNMTGESNYAVNMRTALNKTEIKAREKGLVASLVTVYQKAKAAESAEQREVSPVPVTNDRIRIKGDLLSKKEVWNEYTCATKAIIWDERGFKVYGTLPSAILDAEIGSVVEFDAKVRVAPDDENFGFYSRPTKAAIIA